jgi:hypothetical protein
MVRFDDVRGRGPIVLFFYPKDETPTCTAEACSFRDANADFTAPAAAPVECEQMTELAEVGYRPIAGGGGEHVASCSVPLDGSGQLLRVFHVTGGDAHAAANSLLDDVVAWRDRAGLQRAAAEPARAGGQPLRF